MTNLFTSGHALLIGVGADLPNTIMDAIGLANLLKDEDRCAYPPKQVRLLTGGQATRANILSAMDALSKATTEQSTIIVYFSGHGYQVSASMGAAYYLLPYGYEVNKLSGTAIHGAEWVEKLKAIPAQKMLLLLDCCHAGGLGGLKAPGLEFSKAPLPPEAQSLLAQGRGRVVIASSQADELSFAGNPYSAFTLALIEALCGEGASQNDGYVRVADLALHTREMVPRRTANRQHPILNFEQADNFKLAYYAGGEKQPKGLPFTHPPEVEPDPGAWRGPVFDQQGQTVHGPQTNIAGEVHGPIFSGTFQAPVQVGNGNIVKKIRMSGGVNIEGNAKIGGDLVEGDKIDQSITVGDITDSNDIAIGHGARITKTQTTTGASPIEIAQAFALMMEKVSALPEGPDKEKAQSAVEGLRVEAGKGQAAEEKNIREWFSLLAVTSLEACEVALNFFINPIAGVSSVFKKIAERARTEKQDRKQPGENDAVSPLPDTKS
jgi:hypothetical protein